MQNCCATYTAVRRHTFPRRFNCERVCFQCTPPRRALFCISFVTPLHLYRRCHPTSAGCAQRILWISLHSYAAVAALQNSSPFQLLPQLLPRSVLPLYAASVLFHTHFLSVLATEKACCSQICSSSPLTSGCHAAPAQSCWPQKTAGWTSTRLTCAK